ncbi:MAG: serine/threonine protein kinase [Pseudohongiellaceae bacterium]|jgi:serine/threonine protein kinase
MSSPKTSPTPSQWEQVLAIFDQVADVDMSLRPGLLDRLCADDQDLRDQVQLLLNADASSPELFMEDENLLEYFEPTRPREELGLRAGGRFAEFEIIGLIAEGGMGSVFRARQDQPEREVALKVLRAGLASEDLVRRFEREVAVLGKLQHRGIAAIHAAGVCDGVPYFAMEFVDGVPITEHGASLDRDGCLALVGRVCAAVSHAHEQGIVHRDLKPANILVDGFGEPRVLDFGVARLTDGTSPQTTLATSPGQILGTLAYMSPEQAMGDGFNVDGGADVYALGVILYELLAGHRPLEVERRPIPEALRMLCDVDPVLLGEIDPILRGDLEVIVAKALEKQPDRRYSSVDALADDLERARSNRPINARPPSTLYQMSRFARRHQGLMAGLAATIVTLVVGVVVSLNYAIDASEQRDVAEQATADVRLSLYRTSLLAAMDAVELGDATAARQLLEEAPEERRGFEYRHFAAQVDRSVATLSGDWTPIAWFPDGERLLLNGGAGLLVWRPGSVAGTTAGDSAIAPTWPLDAPAEHVVLGGDGSFLAAAAACTSLMGRGMAPSTLPRPIQCTRALGPLTTATWMAMETSTC